MPALITPFDAAGDLDRSAHHHNLRLLWERGIRGFLLGGSNGEGPYLEPGERRALAETARAAVPEAFLLAGLAAESVRQALSQAEEAAAGGADALLALCPTSLARATPPPSAGTSPPSPPRHRCRYCSTRCRP